MSCHVLSVVRVRIFFFLSHMTLYKALGIVALALSRNILVIRLIHWTCKPQGIWQPFFYLTDTKATGEAQWEAAACSR